MAHWYRSLPAAAPALVILLASLPAYGYTPTNTFGPAARIASQSSRSTMRCTP